MKASRIVSAALFAAPFAGVVALPSAAFAHPKLVATTPAAQATVSNVSKVSLTFSEALLAPVSGVDLVMTAMPGMSGHGPMKVSDVKTALGGGGKVLTATFPKALPAGSYKLDWHVVSTDTHPAKGSFDFSVK